MDAGSIYDTRNDGKLEIVEYVSSRKVFYRFLDTGFFGHTQAGNIKRGTVKDRLKPSVCGVGFVGDGEYKQTTHRRYYNAWKGMLERCYSKKCQDKFPSYIGCTVCKEWHNFQVFCEWLCVRLGRQGGRLEVDKDILVEGNKVYSPSTCMLVTSQQNNEKSKAMNWLLRNPEGNMVEIYNLSKFCRDEGINYSNMHAMATGKRKTCLGWRNQ